jgi:hypothetical protein
MFEIKRVLDEIASTLPVPIVRAHALAVTSLHRPVRQALAELLPPLPDADAEEWLARLAGVCGIRREVRRLTRQFRERGTHRLTN